MNKFNVEKIRNSEQLLIKINGKETCTKTTKNILRVNCISVRLNDKELSKLNYLRGNYAKSVWLRMASLQKIPPIIPAINLNAWKALSEISQKLNRIALHIDSKSKDSKLTHTELFAVNRQLAELRQNLLSADIWSNPDEGNAEDQTW